MRGAVGRLPARAGPGGRAACGPCGRHGHCPPGTPGRQQVCGRAHAQGRAACGREQERLPGLRILLPAAHGAPGAEEAGPARCRGHGVVGEGGAQGGAGGHGHGSGPLPHQPGNGHPGRPQSRGHRALQGCPGGRAGRERLEECPGLATQGRRARGAERQGAAGVREKVCRAYQRGNHCGCEDGGAAPARFIVAGKKACHGFCAG
mmetsp:Transcript_58040/g.164942  ORF Transcript_58040/g.164942 Transcript_58040/m.164942 type:complete len:205 (-) Transcript_58040:340-954(-)